MLKTEGEEWGRREGVRKEHDMLNTALIGIRAELNRDPR